MIKLVCIDLDGTLLDDKKEISSKNREAIKELQKLGVQVTIFTGRSYHSALAYVNQLDIQIPVVFQNGALICTPDRQKIFRQVWLDGEIAISAVELSKQFDVYPVVYESFFSEKDMYVESDYEGAFEEYFRQNLSRTNFISDLIGFLQKTPKIVEIALVGHVENVQAVVENLSKKYESQFTPVKNRQIDDTVFLEIFGKDVGKEIALDFLLNLFDASPSDTMFIGDNYNDLEVMKKVGYPVAMGNAPDEVKKVAKFITSTNNDSGVAKAIEEILIKRR
ncbi:Cof-type HAD-IIB family hydrolase [Pseudothermotoga thermarum]|nr:Cof-type HAD-IIB family hydrolase [Pseudothermotoga thermarum]